MGVRGRQEKSDKGRDTAEGEGGGVQGVGMCLCVWLAVFDVQAALGVCISQLLITDCLRGPCQHPTPKHPQYSFTHLHVQACTHSHVC